MTVATRSLRAQTHAGAARGGPSAAPSPVHACTPPCPGRTERPTTAAVDARASRAAGAAAARVRACRPPGICRTRETAAPPVVRLASPRQEAEMSASDVLPGTRAPPRLGTHGRAREVSGGVSAGKRPLWLQEQRRHGQCCRQRREGEEQDERRGGKARGGVDDLRTPTAPARMRRAGCARRGPAQR